MAINLYSHQIKALDKVKGLDNCAFYLDMGLGKTYVGSEKMMNYGSKVNLVVCQKSKIKDWVKHFEENYRQHIVIDLTEKKSLGEFLFNVDSIIEGICLNDSVIGIINYDLVWRRPELLNLTNFTLMLDESSLIQIRTSKRSKFILKMKPEHVILLSGTPIDGRYERLWSQIHLLGWNITETMFKNSYTVEDYAYNWRGQKVLNPVNGRPIKHTIGYKNVEHLKRKLDQYGCVFMKSDEAIDLPEQNFNDIYVPISKDYKKFKKTKIVTVDDTKLKGDTSLTAMLYKRQLCGIYSKEKMSAFLDLVNSTSDRIIVFYNFTEELERMVASISDRPISIVNGSKKDLTAYDNDDNSIIFIQYQAGAYGLNLQKANKTIYYSLPLSSEAFEQSKKRTHRIGQGDKCFYYVMICRDSIEEDIYETLKLRRSYTLDLYAKDESMGYV